MAQTGTGKKEGKKILKIQTVDKVQNRDNSSWEQISNRQSRHLDRSC
jgi:hypothetical protein